MPTQDDIDKIAHMSEQERIKLALETLDEYKKIIEKLTHEQRQILLKAMTRVKENERRHEIEILEQEINNYNPEQNPN